MAILNPLFSILELPFSILDPPSSIFHSPSSILDFPRPFSSKLQRAQADHRADETDDPKAHDDLRLFPALELIVMMDRRHQEHSLAPELVRDHLENHRERL